MRAGSVIAGKYRLLRSIGQGAMGVVWAAVNESTERQVALKLIPSTLADNEELRARLIREARACGRISHRNVVEIYDADATEDGDPFLVMPLLVGETLAARIERDQILTQPVAARFAFEIARGLAAVHAAGIVHRDLKPGNTFLVRESDDDADTVKLLDFGVSKILTAQDAVATATGSALGSPAYMSPEQARGDRDIDHRTDLWAFGVVLFEMLTGTRPFVGDSPYAVVADILGGHIPDVREREASIDPQLASIIASCLQRDLATRASSASEIAQSLRAFLGAPRADTSGPALPISQPQVATHRPLSPSVTSTTPVLAGRLAPPPRRSTLPLVIAGASVVFVGVVAIGAAVFTLKSHDKSTQATATTTSTAEPVTTTTAPTSIPTASTVAAPSATASSIPSTRPFETHGPRQPPPARSAKPTTRLPTDPG